MKHLALVLFFVPLAAFAGKAERDFMKSEVVLHQRLLTSCAQM
jgi:hypothetical protein